MKWKIKKYPAVVYKNEFLIFPKKFGDYKYWWCWATIEYQYLDYLKRYSRGGKIVTLGKNAVEYNEQFNRI